MSHRSPKRVQPIPIIATLSLIPSAISVPSLKRFMTIVVYISAKTPLA
jgi:hypothetical protein